MVDKKEVLTRDSWELGDMGQKCSVAFGLLRFYF